MFVLKASFCPVVLITGAKGERKVFSIPLGLRYILPKGYNPFSFIHTHTQTCMYLPGAVQITLNVLRRIIRLSVKGGGFVQRRWKGFGTVQVQERRMKWLVCWCCWHVMFLGGLKRIERGVVATRFVHMLRFLKGAKCFPLSFTKTHTTLRGSCGYTLRCSQQQQPFPPAEAEV